MKKTLSILLHRLREQLWFRPLLFCLGSVGGALVAHQADGTQLDSLVPSIKLESIESLLDTIAASMLVISTFAVASMISAFSAASNTATPRSFKIVVTDDVSQYALSVFIGAFIFSIVATVALNNGYYGKAGIFILFLFTLLAFAVVILTFLRWVDRISRLGRLEHTIKQVEQVATKALARYIQYPLLGAMPLKNNDSKGYAILSESVGYVQHFNMDALQSLAEELDIRIDLHCLPGNYIHQNMALAFVQSSKEIQLDELAKKINNAIHVGDTRLYDEDPRFGLIALSEIASRAMSPAVNDPGTAIQIIGSFERLFFLWNDALKEKQDYQVRYSRISVAQISMRDFFNDAFRPISRDGAANIEVMLRLQKVFTSIATIQMKELKETAEQFSEESYQRAEQAMNFKPDLDRLKETSLFNK